MFGDFRRLLKLKWKMVNHIKDLLRHRIHRVLLKETQKIKRRFREQGIPGVHGNPKSTLNKHSLHKVKNHENGSRVEVCIKDEEK